MCNMLGYNILSFGYIKEFFLDLVYSMIIKIRYVFLENKVEMCRIYF